MLIIFPGCYKINKLIGGVIPGGKEDGKTREKSLLLGLRRVVSHTAPALSLAGL